MYILFGIFLAVCIVFAFLQYCRRKRMICKVEQMDPCSKVCLLNDILTPFGFCYLEQQDIITSIHGAWQRQFGYCTLFDRSAVHFGMAFDCEPVYFYYKKRTYRIELWKGQYGINMGAEAGIYYAKGIVAPQEFDKTHFRSVPDAEMLPMEMALYYKGQKMFEYGRRHWWLTGFCMGQYCDAKDLMLRISITFEDQNMRSCFVKSLMHMGYQECDIDVCDLTVSFSFSFAHSKQPCHSCCLKWKWAQWKNRLLFLFLFLPPAFYRMCLCRRSRKQKFHKRKCKKECCRYKRRCMHGL